MWTKEQNLVNLSVSASAIFISLLWLFFGRWFMGQIIGPDFSITLYAFISGIVLSLGLLGFVLFVKTLLQLTEFIVEKDSLPLLMYRSVMTDDSEGIFFKDRKGRYRIINEIACQVMGLEGKDVLGATDQELHHSILAHKIEQEDRRVLENGETVVWEVEANTRLGRESFICKKLPCRDRKGRTVGITGLCKNITVLKTFQNLNVELEEHYRQLFNRLPFPVLVLDVNTMLPFTFNESMTALLGFNRDTFANTRFTTHAAEGDADSLRGVLAEMKRSGGGEFEVRLKTRNKDEVDVAGYAQEIVIEEKAFLNIILHDITETKRATNELISSELKYRSLFEHANDAILIVDIATLQIVDANDVALSFLDYGRDELKLLTIYDLDAAADHERTQFKLNDLEIYNHVLYEHEIRSRKNKCHQVEINAHKVNYGNDVVYQFVIRNISERKKTEQALIASEQRYRQMFESNRAVKLVLNLQSGFIEDANQAAADFYGYSKEQMKGMPVAQINVLSNEKLVELIATSREQKQGFYTCPHKLANGDIRFVEVRDGPMDIDGQELLYSIIHDVTASKHAEDQLMLASKMFDYSSDAAMITDDRYRVVSVNQAFIQITGYQQSEILGQEPGMILAGRDETLFTDELIAEVKQIGQWQGEIWHRLKDGETRPLKSIINVVKDEAGRISNFVVFMTPAISYRDEEASRKANYTGLTSLPNKSLFADRMQYAIDRCQRSDKQLALLLVDFRNFSDINAEHGYDVGDHVLKAIAKRLKYNVRESDCVAHFSADDFAVFLEDLSDVQQTGTVAQKIISTLAESYQVDDQEIKLEVSIGIAIAPVDGVRVEHLMDKASVALRNAQQVSGNQFKFCSSELDADAQFWLQMEQNLHKALRNDELFVIYLPQYAVGNLLQPEAVEALVRWKYDGDRPAMPEHFLPTAEQCGFIGAIGHRVITKSIATLSAWAQQQVPHVPLHINICPTQIDDEFVDFVIQTCNDYVVDAKQICFDMTENKFINLTHEQRKWLQKLHDLGFRICIDDFGSGSASLSCLLQCPVDAIKIDPGLVARAVTDTGAMSLLQGILSLATTLDIEAIAEGVETEQQYELLNRLGCRHMQGYYLSEELLPDQIPQLFKTTEASL